MGQARGKSGKPGAKGAGHGPKPAGAGRPVGKPGEKRDAKPFSRPGGKPGGKFEGNPYGRPGARPVGRPVGRLVARPAVAGEAREGGPISLPVSRPASARPVKPFSKPLARPGARLMGKPGARAVGKPGAKLTGLPSARPVGKPVAKLMGKPGARPVGKPSAKLMGKPTGRLPAKAPGRPAAAAMPAPQLDPLAAAKLAWQPTLRWCQKELRDSRLMDPKVLAAVQQFQDLVKAVVTAQDVARFQEAQTHAARYANEHTFLRWAPKPSPLPSA